MSQQVKVTSLDALESFRASLIIFMTKARRSVDEAGEEIRRTRTWLQTEQRVHWEGQLKRRRKLLDQATQELVSARFSEFNDSPTLQQSQVRKAKAAVEEAEEKLLKVKKWSREFDHYAEPLMKRMEGLRYYLEHDVPEAVVYLSQAQRTLESYAETAPPVAPAPAAASETPSS